MKSALYQTLDKNLLSTVFSPRTRDAHKGDFGHVLIIGGDYGMGGAVRLSAEAALRVGAGLVSVATHPEHVALVSSACPEVMCHGIEKASAVEPLLDKASVVIVGPGLGKTKWSRHLFELAMTVDLPTVVDADALNLLSESPCVAHNWILTPHPGEAARLLQQDIESVEADRIESANALVNRFGGVVVLKGAGTIIEMENELPAICPYGNPGMATAGMGDVLSGVIGGLLAQHFSLLSAAKIGVLLHAVAGDEAARVAGERGLIATDLMPYLHRLVN
jgi:hydroxyethylthiazole kinase-like uncharacterized protein yjeF